MKKWHSIAILILSLCLCFTACDDKTTSLPTPVNNDVVIDDDTANYDYVNFAVEGYSSLAINEINVFILANKLDLPLCTEDGTALPGPWSSNVTLYPSGDDPDEPYTVIFYDLSGAIDFTPLENCGEIYASDNYIADANLQGLNQLKTLNLSGNDLYTLDASGLGSLEYLDCGYNESLTALDLSGLFSLTELYCPANSIQALDFTDTPLLIGLGCSSNNLDALDVTGLTELQKLYCSRNNLTELDLTNNLNLVELLCDENNLSSLEFSHIPYLAEINSDFDIESSFDSSAILGGYRNGAAHLYLGEDGSYTMTVGGGSIGTNYYISGNQISMGSGTAVYKNGEITLEGYKGVFIREELAQWDEEDDALYSLLSGKNFWHYTSEGFSSWDGEWKSSSASSLMGIAEELGFSVTTNIDEFTAAMDALYEKEPDLSQWDAACAVLEIDGAPYVEFWARAYPYED